MIQQKISLQKDIFYQIFLNVTYKDLFKQNNQIHDLRISHLAFCVFTHIINYDNPLMSRIQLQVISLIRS